MSQASGDDAGSALSEGEWAELTAKISRERGFQCSSYKDKCLRRRIAMRMRARGVHRYDDYASLLSSDAREYDLLVDALTINVTKFFRNADVFAAIAAGPVAALWAGGAPIRAWSAGTASGEEAYSVAILFHRHAERAGDGDDASRAAVLGTDIDRRCLDAARAGAYGEAAFAETTLQVRQRYFSATTPFAIDANVKAMTTFARHDLLHEPPPGATFELIVCRNVLIYFDRASQERTLSAFADATVPGGTLVLGKVETVLGPARSAFVSVDGRARLFRRV
ncbi:MAG: protein-glutamate O-methyltransferase CheR [Gemmatimonadaceae bacterium]